MKIKILGTGCSRCKALQQAVEESAKELGLTAEITKEEDLMKIMEYNVVTLPALVIEEKVVASGKISAQEIKTLLTI